MAALRAFYPDQMAAGITQTFNFNFKQNFGEASPEMTALAKSLQFPDDQLIGDQNW